LQPESPLSRHAELARRQLEVGPSSSGWPSSKCFTVNDPAEVRTCAELNADANFTKNECNDQENLKTLLEN
jgi:hypothetical protein